MYKKGSVLQPFRIYSMKQRLDLTFKISLTPHINGIKEKTHVIILVEAEKII